MPTPDNLSPAELARRWVTWARSAMLQTQSYETVWFGPEPRSWHEALAALDYLLERIDAPVQVPGVVALSEHVHLNRRLDAHERAIAILQKLHDFKSETNYGHEHG